MPGIIDVANLARVSKSTVSRVLNNNGPVDDNTRSAVLEAMRKLNYTPNVFARGMRTNRSRSLGILFPELSNPFFIEWYKTAEGIARSHGYMLYICITDEQGDLELPTIRDLMARHIDGLVFFTYQNRAEVREELRKINTNTPVVFADPGDYASTDSYIYSNGYNGIYDAVMHLVRSGKRRIAFVKGEERFWVTSDRYHGYRQALQDAGISFDPVLVERGDFTEHAGYEAAGKLMKIQHPPEAIVAVTDGMALGVLRFLNESGIPVPQRVCVVGFDNIAATKVSKPPLTTIALDIAEKAEMAISYLVKRNEEPHLPPLQQVFKPTMMLRASTGNQQTELTNQLLYITTLS